MLIKPQVKMRVHLSHVLGILNNKIKLKRHYEASYLSSTDQLLFWCDNTRMRDNPMKLRQLDPASKIRLNDILMDH